MSRIHDRIRHYTERLRAARPTGEETRRLLALGRPEAPSIGAALVLLAGQTVTSLAVPWLLAQLLDRLIEFGLDSVTDGLATLGRYTGAILLLFAARSILSSGQSYLLARAGERVVLRLRNHLYSHLLRLGPPFYDHQRVGGLVSRVVSDVTRLQGAATSDVASFLTASVTLFGAMGLLLWQNWRLAMLLIVVVPPVVLLARFNGRRQRKLGEMVQDRQAAVAGVVEESLGAIRLLQSFVREPYERGRFETASRALMDASLERARVVALFGSAISFVVFAALAGILFAGGREVILGRLTPGTLVAYVVYTQMVASSAGQLVGLYGSWSGALGAGRKVFALLDTPPSVEDKPDAMALTQPVEGRVTFEGVGFAYGRGGAVLHDIDLDVAPGETVALVGPSGAGKSTLMHLVARFYDPQDGRLTLDGRDLRDLRLAELRAAIGLVPQETTLFNATIAENLRYGRLDATDEELRAAAEAAFAAPFVEALPDGYDTLVGERGIRLSAGERQRIAIARALLKDPRILLLDEATASLDSQSESLVQAALERLMAGRTSLVIAHRLSTVHNADRIAVVERGRIVEVGPHAALIAKGGLYERLHALQFREPEREGG
jgi:subfamily B ATP-binding cassette protein MsbA